MNWWLLDLPHPLVDHIFHLDLLCTTGPCNLVRGQSQAPQPVGLQGLRCVGSGKHPVLPAVEPPLSKWVFRDPQHLPSQRGAVHVAVPLSAFRGRLQD